MLHNVIFEGFRRIATRAAAAACMTVVISDHVATMRWVHDDAMSPVLFSLESSHDLALVVRASRYYLNDVVMYLNPVDGSECFGRLVKMNTSRDLSAAKAKVPCGHCWVENDNPRSDTPDSRTFGAIPMGLLRGCVFGTVYPLSRAKVVVT